MIISSVVWPKSFYFVGYQNQNDWNSELSFFFFSSGKKTLFFFPFLTFCRNCEWKCLQTRPKWKYNLSKSKIQKDFVDFNVMKRIICLCNNFLSAQYSWQVVPPSTPCTYRQVVRMIKILWKVLVPCKRKAKHVLWFLFKKILEKNIYKTEVLHFISSWFWRNSIRSTLSD